VRRGRVATKKELAKWIKKGLKNPNVTEEVCCYISTPDEEGCRACALGLALVGKLGDEKKAIDAYWKDRYASDEYGWGYLAELLGIRKATAKRVNLLHAVQGVTAAEIATKLGRE
jgi:hypothetical protein